MKIMIKRAVGSLALATLLGGVVGTSPAAAVETGQLLDKGPRWPHKSITRTIGSAECPGPACTPDVIDKAVRRGEITPQQAKTLGKIQRNLQANAGGASGNPGWIIPSLSVIAVAGGVLAVTSGKSKPASPN